MKFSSFLIILFLSLTSIAQQSETDSLRALLRNAREDSGKVLLLVELSEHYRFTNPDSQFLFANNGLQLAQSIHYIRGQVNCWDQLAGYWWERGDYASALKFDLMILDYYTSIKDTLTSSIVYSTLLNSYRDQGDYPDALHYGFLMLNSVAKNGDFGIGMIHAMIGSVYLEMQQYDSALYYSTKAVHYPPNISIGWIFLTHGRIFAKTKRTDSAFKYYWLSLHPLKEDNNLKDLTGAYISIAELYAQTGKVDSAIFFGKEGMKIARQVKLNKELLQSCILLGTIYEKLNADTALYYYKASMKIRDSLYNQEKLRTVFSYKFNADIREKEIKNIQQQLENKNRTSLFIAILIAFLLFVIFLIYNNKRKQRVNQLLQKQKMEIEETLGTLRETQAQLIQQEKMASLGELTAGIAHEIQNPLNFVNNFSEVNKELLEELKAEQNREFRDLKLENELLINIEQNLEKINHHGKRAEAIVKGMLQHSNTNTGKKEPTNINVLADEYLRLCYHGLRSKDKSFSAGLETAYDDSIGMLDLVPQDMGRVLLNLFGNAFYSVREKQKKGQDSYEPAVSINTKKMNNKVEIRIRDNGFGIPNHVVTKIFQPFFTTKPTGQGTGLGLSLSYDIITKEHNGTLRVETKDGEYAEFIIELPA